MLEKRSTTATRTSSTSARSRLSRSSLNLPTVVVLVVLILVLLLDHSPQSPLLPMNMVPVLLVPKSVLRHCYYCFPPTARACPVVAFSTAPRRRRSPFVTTTDSNGGWYDQDDNDTILCQQRRWIHAASPMLLLASSSSLSSSSSTGATTTNSTNSTTTTATTTTTTNNNNNSNSNEKETIPSTIASLTVKKDDETPLPPVVLQDAGVLSRSRSSWSRRWRKGLGDVFSTVGFLSSSLSSLVRDPFQVWDQTQEPLRAFRNFLQTSGIDKELNQALSTSALSMALLFRVHSSSLLPNKNHHQQDPPQDNMENGDSILDDTLDATFWTRAKRYMRFATAVYGRAMIRAATVDAYGNFKDLAESVGQETLQTISNHVQVPVQDLIWVEVDYDYDNNDKDTDTDHDTTTTTTTTTDNNKETTTTNNKDHYLRHLVAVDHTHQEVVLAIRGTFSIQEILVDLTSFSREGFAGGEAHEGMATMAERLWQVAGPVIVQTLKEHPDYRLVVTGHSLGAGTASLLTILLKQQQQQQRWGQASSSSSAPSYSLIPPTTHVQCFAYASPPVFTPLDLIPHVTPLITNFIHERDVVPFLSVYSVRHLLASLQAIQSVPLSLTEKLAIIAGSQPPPPELLAAVQNVPSIVPIRGAPRLHVPASKTIWLHTPSSPRTKRTTTSSQDDADATITTGSATTTYSVCKTLPFEIRVHPNMLVDHFPARYEYALEHLPIKK